MRLHLPVLAFALLGGLALLPMVAPSAAVHATEDAASGDVVFQVRIDERRGGDVLCALYRDEGTWLSERPFRDAQSESGAAWATCVFSAVPHDTYAIAALHDENGNGEMDKNFIGLPVEGYAASRDAHQEGIGAPDWDDAIFAHRSDQTVQRARMKY